MSYWQDRMAASQTKLTNKSVKQIENQLKKYYGAAMKRTIEDFEATYNKLLVTIGKDKEPTPADLYKLDKYWQMQGQMRQELQKLGDKQVAALSKAFEQNFFEVYNSIGIPGMKEFNTIDSSMVQQLINHIWVADGKSWSQRIWENNEKLAATLNDELVNCVVSGKKTTDLKNILQERFNVGYGRADALVRTELAHIQTQAAQKRYENYGIQEMEVWADEDERRCEVCGKLHQKRYPIGAVPPIPAHPKCRCCIVPVVEEEKPVEPITKENPLKNDNDYQKMIRERRKAFRNRENITTEKPKVNFSIMSKDEIATWSKTNLKVDIDYKGATEEVARISADTLLKLENKGVNLEGIKVIYGDTGGMYGRYNPNTKTIHLRKNTNFVERLLEEDRRASYKLGRSQWAVSSYEGLMTHEIGHAIDDLTGKALSSQIAKNDDLFIKGIKISNYAGTSPGLGANRASETFAENFSAYMDDKAKHRVAPEIAEIIENYLKKNKKKS